MKDFLPPRLLKEDNKSGVVGGCVSELARRPVGGSTPQQHGGVADDLVIDFHIYHYLFLSPPPARSSSPLADSPLILPPGFASSPLPVSANAVLLCSSCRVCSISVLLFLVPLDRLFSCVVGYFVVLFRGRRCIKVRCWEDEI